MKTLIFINRSYMLNLKHLWTINFMVSAASTFIYVFVFRFDTLFIKHYLLILWLRNLCRLLLLYFGCGLIRQFSFIFRLFVVLLFFLFDRNLLGWLFLFFSERRTLWNIRCGTQFFNFQIKNMGKTVMYFLASFSGDLKILHS